jgi:hypothetical protein
VSTLQREPCGLQLRGQMFDLIIAGEPLSTARGVRAIELTLESSERGMLRAPLHGVNGSSRPPSEHR